MNELVEAKSPADRRAYLATSTATVSVPPILHNLVMVGPRQWRGAVPMIRRDLFSVTGSP